MHKIYIPFLIFFAAIILVLPLNAQTLSQQLSGKILLQVEENGEAWYVYPQTDLRYFLGRPHDAFDVMRNLGLGISNSDLARVEVDMSHEASAAEVGQQVASVDSVLSARVSGRIVLQVEKNGEAWYINPENNKRYFLGRPADAFSIMRGLGLGISNSNLAQIGLSPNSATPPSGSDQPIEQPQEEVSQDGVRSVTVVAGEYSFSPSTILVKQGERVRLTLQNSGVLIHNLVIEGEGVSTLNVLPGETDVIEFDANEAGTITFYCSIGNHRALGMEGEIIVEAN